MDSSADKSIDNALSHTFVGPVNAPSFGNFLASSRRFLAAPIIGRVPSFPDKRDRTSTVRREEQSTGRGKEQGQCQEHDSGEEETPARNVNHGRKYGRDATHGFSWRRAPLRLTKDGNGDGVRNATKDDLLKKAAIDLNAQLEYEDQSIDDKGTGATAQAMTAQAQATTGAEGVKRRRSPVARDDEWCEQSTKLMKVRRRCRRNKAELYVLEYVWRPVERVPRGEHDVDGARLVPVADYEEYLQIGRVVEDSTNEEGVKQVDGAP
ncbi:hypothetical protein PC122_g15913 [Phytophthora cactorum]|nr:hypothetical protein PC122_g15913 [Phytophthora cactorum]